MGRRFCFALVGSGRIGKVHFKHLLLNERCSVKYIVEEDHKSAKQMLSRYNLEDSLTVLGTDSINRVYEDREYVYINIAVLS